MREYARKYIGATLRAVDRTHGLRPVNPNVGLVTEVITEVIDDYSLIVKTDQGNVYSNGDFSIVRWAEAGQ